MSAYDLVKTAILQKRNISATYKNLYRELSPHVIGTKNGRTKALLYQCGGDSSSGLAAVGSTENWRCVFVDDLLNVKLIEGEWQSEAVYAILAREWRA